MAAIAILRAQNLSSDLNDWDSRIFLEATWDCITRGGMAVPYFFLELDLRDTRISTIE
jgi:hypothetical protein